MTIKYEVLDNMLLGLTETDDITLRCKKEISEFIINHDINVFSDFSLRELSGIFKLSISPAYTAVTGEYMPNIFVKEGVDYGHEEQ